VGIHKIGWNEKGQARDGEIKKKDVM